MQRPDDHKIEPITSISRHSLSDIPNLPFDSFEELRLAVSKRTFSVGVDSLAASQWFARLARRPIRATVAFLSLLFVAAALGSLVVTFVEKNYWLLLCIPIMAITFFFSTPDSSYRRWVTIGAAVLIAVFLNLLLNQLWTASVLAAYAIFTFAVVRVVGLLTDRVFRNAILKNEASFVDAYLQGLCSLREKETKRVYSTGSRGLASLD